MCYPPGRPSAGPPPYAPGRLLTSSKVAGARFACAPRERVPPSEWCAPKHSPRVALFAYMVAALNRPLRGFAPAGLGRPRGGRAWVGRRRPPALAPGASPRRPWPSGPGGPVPPVVGFSGSLLRTPPPSSLSSSARPGSCGSPGGHRAPVRSRAVFRACPSHGFGRCPPGEPGVPFNQRLSRRSLLSPCRPPAPPAPQGASGGRKASGGVGGLPAPAAAAAPPSETDCSRGSVRRPPHCNGGVKAALRRGRSPRP